MTNIRAVVLRMGAAGDRMLEGVEDIPAVVEGHRAVAAHLMPVVARLASVAVHLRPVVARLTLELVHLTSAVGRLTSVVRRLVPLHILVERNRSSIDRLHSVGPISAYGQAVRSRALLIPASPSNQGPAAIRGSGVPGLHVSVRVLGPVPE